MPAVNFQKYCGDVIIFKRMKHENVLGIEGVAPELFQFCMVLRWMENGNMLEYLNLREDIDRLVLVSTASDYIASS